MVALCFVKAFVFPPRTSKQIRNDGNQGGEKKGVEEKEKPPGNPKKTLFQSPNSHVGLWSEVQKDPKVH